MQPTSANRSYHGDWCQGQKETGAHDTPFANVITAWDLIDKHNKHPKTKKIQNDKTPPRQNKIVEMQKALEETSMEMEIDRTDTINERCNKSMQEREKLPDTAMQDHTNSTEDKADNKTEDPQDKQQTSSATTSDKTERTTNQGMQRTQ